MNTRNSHSLVSWTAAALILVGLAFFYYHKKEQSKPQRIETAIYPTIGNHKASVNIVVFEEPRCVDCMFYNNTIYPQIFKEYIQTNKVSYTLIPISFLPNSSDVVAALMCVYYQDPKASNPELFFKLFDYIYEEKSLINDGPVTQEEILSLAAAASPDINLRKLKSSLESHYYHKKVLENTDYAMKIMGGKLETPSIYINGIKLEDITYQNMQKLIETELKKRSP